METTTLLSAGLLLSFIFLILSVLRKIMALKIAGRLKELRYLLITGKNKIEYEQNIPSSVVPKITAKETRVEKKKKELEQRKAELERKMKEELEKITAEESTL